MSYGIRRKFYNSKAWNDVRKTVWLKQNLLCATCNEPVYVNGISKYLPKEKRKIGIVHHKVFLNNDNIDDINITLNIDNLEGVCKDCHEKIHNQNNIIRQDLMFDEEGNVVPIK